VPPASKSWQNRKGSREELVDSVERECADFIQEYFKIEWPDARFITLMNTASGDEAIVDMILSCRQTPEARGAA
jgi:hypothetical protein